MKVLDLFSGIGGFSLGLERAGMETVAFCEKDKFCQKILKQYWANVDIIDDIRDLNGYYFNDGVVDLICGGFPCVGFSVGGKGEGFKNEQSGLWAEFYRIIQEARPRWVLIENVEHIRRKGLGVILRDLSKIGYNAEWHCLTANGTTGLPHQRDRLFLISYPSCFRLYECAGEKRLIQTYEEWSSEEIYTEGEECKLKPGAVCTILPKWALEDFRNSLPNQRTTLSDIRRVTDGVPEGLDEKERKLRIRALGNSIVPQIAEFIGKELMKIGRRGL